ncbi:hypothetical protein DFP73DRAFT_601011 [Morchella snyderi]|nr:hypothetical protein DFP73DRAFT_601011 [Morchella snyderi]
MIYQHKVSSTITPSLLSHHPYSLPLLGRLENPQRSSSSLILATFPESSSSPYGLFTAAYIDQSRRGESQAWFFCSAGELELKVARRQMSDMLSYIKSCQPGPTQDRDEDKEQGLLVIASLNSLLVNVVQDICTAGGVRLSQEFMKYLFHHSPPPPPPSQIVGGLEFGELRPEDMGRVIATSSIRRHKDTLLLLKNAALFKVTEDKRIPIAWAFIGFDGSLATWWVEEGWRARGCGTAVARKVMQHWRNGSKEGNLALWGHADVVVDNWTSRRGMVGLGGVEGWIVRWLYVDLNGLGNK